MPFENGHSRRPAGARGGFTLIELLVVVVIIGILASVAMPSFVSAQDRARNASMQGNARTVQTCLEQYAADYNGEYPTADYSRKGRKKKGSAKRGTSAPLDGLEDYLPSGEMPRAPWCRDTQESFLMPSDPLVSAKKVAEGEELLTPIGRTHYSNGKVGDPPTKTEHFGAIAYGYETNQAVYVLYGLGKKNKAVVVANSLSNNGGASGGGD